jgi:dolichol-phosphate mannosyltransferase
MKTVILIATYNERDNIVPLLEQVFTTVPEAHVLVIDDSSPDKTYELVQNLQQTKYMDKLFLLQRAGKLGLGTAYGC